MRYIIGLSLLTISLTLPAVAEDEKACTKETIKGTYSVTCTGFLSPAAGAPQLPASLLGLVTGDSAGVFSGAAKMSLGGSILNQVAIGPAIVNKDCTGSVKYSQWINGQAAGYLNIVFNILKQGEEIRGMGVDPGATLVCKLTLMHRDEPKEHW